MVRVKTILVLLNKNEKWNYVGVCCISIILDIPSHLFQPESRSMRFSCLLSTRRKYVPCSPTLLPYADLRYSFDGNRT